ncbi:unnamed protein product [marine sediment metagenome]|uniref:Uncharacterized protein n=1 Tax=marine sediment metagenome TaxID=412755 RepID=X1DUY1_9ZZZZ
MSEEQIDRSRMRYVSLEEMERINHQVRETGVCPTCGKSDNTEIYCDGLYCCRGCGWCLGFDANKGYFEYAGVVNESEEGKEINTEQIKQFIDDWETKEGCPPIKQYELLSGVKMS